MYQIRTQRPRGGLASIRLRVSLLVGLLVGLGGSAVVTAGEGGDAPGDGAKIIERLRALRPDLPIEGVSQAPVPGMFSIELTGGQMLYATADARFLFAGDLYEIGETDLVNLAEERRVVTRRDLLATVNRNEQVIFSPEGTVKASVMVFTDVDCGYCRKLHLEVPKLNELGVEVRYVAFPRAGIGSESYDKIVSAWCADDRNEAITRLKRGERIEPATCDNPVAKQYQLGKNTGVTGTPAIVLPDGYLLPGYLPADELAAVLGL